MAKKSNHAYSIQARSAVKLLGKLIKQHRLERKIPAAQIAERAGIGRAMLKRIEDGVMSVSVGSVFEVATILGVPLISQDKDQLDRLTKQTDQVLSLLPKTAPKRARVVKDDF